MSLSSANCKMQARKIRQRGWEEEKKHIWAGSILSTEEKSTPLVVCPFHPVLFLRCAIRRGGGMSSSSSSVIKRFSQARQQVMNLYNRKIDLCVGSQILHFVYVSETCRCVRLSYWVVCVFPPFSIFYHSKKGMVTITVKCKFLLS